MTCISETHGHIIHHLTAQQSTCTYTRGASALQTCRVSAPQDGIDTEDPIDEDALEHDEAGWQWEVPHDEGRDDSDDGSDDDSDDDDEGDGVGEGQDDNSQSQDDTPTRKEYHPHLNGK